MSDSYNAVKAVILNKEGNFLLLQRNPKISGQNNWDFPGGLIESGEDERQALLREVKEELGIDVKIVSLGGRWRFLRSRDNKWVQVQNYKCEIVRGEIELSEEHVDYKWVNPANIENYSVKDRSFYNALSE